MRRAHTGIPEVLAGVLFASTGAGATPGFHGATPQSKSSAPADPPLYDPANLRMSIRLTLWNSGDKRPSRNAIFVIAGWLAFVLLLATQHAFWRDEVRALSIALRGRDVFDMLGQLHGEGHPAAWYLLLRASFAVFQSNAVLPGVALAVALGSALLLVFRSPFGLPLIALLLFGRVLGYEYSVMARNYGISMLLVFTFASLYGRYRSRGPWLGLVLFALVNCNVHSVFIGCGLMLFWILDRMRSKGTSEPGAARHLLYNGALLTAGILLCLATVYPPVNDAAQISRSLAPLEILRHMLLPAQRFGELAGRGLADLLLSTVSNPTSNPWHATARNCGLTVLLVGSTMGLIRRPAAVVSAVSVLIAMSLLFALVYRGDYRHQALWLVFLVSLYWITREKDMTLATPARTSRVEILGQLCFVVLVTVQLLSNVLLSGQILAGKRSESQSRNLANLIESTPLLRDAIIVADPDFLVEPVPYYLSNPTYLMREGRFGNVVVFSRSAILTLTVADVLANARKLRDASGRPVVILMSEKLDPSSPARSVRWGYNWRLTTSAPDIRAFLSATRLVGQLRPPCCTDESFDVYVLDEKALPTTDDEPATPRDGD